MNRLTLIGAMALSLAACGSIPSPFQTPQSTQVTIDKAEYALEVAYSAAAQGYLAAEASLPAQTKAQAKGLLLQILDCPTATTCTGYLATARAARDAGDATTVNAQVQAITTLASQVTALAGSK